MKNLIAFLGILLLSVSCSRTQNEIIPPAVDPNTSDTVTRSVENVETEDSDEAFRNLRKLDDYIK